MISHYYRLFVAHPQLLFRSQRWSNSTPPGDSTKKKRLNLDFCVEAMGEEAAQLIINAFVAPGQKLCLSRVSRSSESGGWIKSYQKLWYHITWRMNIHLHILIYPDLSAWRWGDCMAFHMFLLGGTWFWDFARDLIPVCSRLAFCIVTYCNTPWTLSLGGFCQFEGQKLRLDPFGFLQV